MSNTTIAFILTFVAGFSTLFGTIFIFLKNKNDKVINACLSFASGVMITVSITDLIPESYNILINLFPKFPAILYVAIFFVSGVILSFFIDKKVDKIESKNHLYKVGIISMIGLIIHNIPEGIATFMATSSDIKLGISIAIAILIHNIPEGISISVPIYYATDSRLKAILYTLISGISEPIGAIITYLFLYKLITLRILGFIFGLIAGIMFHIAFYELLPTAKKYKSNNLTFIFFVLGVLFMVLNHFILK